MTFCSEALQLRKSAHGRKPSSGNFQSPCRVGVETRYCVIRVHIEGCLNLLRAHVCDCVTCVTCVTGKQQARGRRSPGDATFQAGFYDVSRYLTISCKNSFSSFQPRPQSVTGASRPSIAHLNCEPKRPKTLGSTLYTRDMGKITLFSAMFCTSW